MWFEALRLLEAATVPYGCRLHPAGGQRCLTRMARSLRRTRAMRPPSRAMHTSAATPARPPAMLATAVPAVLSAWAPACACDPTITPRAPTSSQAFARQYRHLLGCALCMRDTPAAAMIPPRRQTFINLRPPPEAQRGHMLRPGARPALSAAAGACMFSGHIGGMRSVVGCEWLAARQLGALSRPCMHASGIPAHTAGAHAHSGAGRAAGPR